MRLEDPYEKIENFRKEMEKIFGKMKEVDLFVAKGLEKARVNLKKEKGEYVFDIEMPGVPKENIEVNIIGDILEVKGKKSDVKKKKNENYIYAESFAQSFVRRVKIPEDADLKKVKAKYENGVLTIRIKKKSVKGKSKKIKVE